MNYRHAYHAGNFADVVKHAVLALVIERLKRKETPFRIIDTHAGAGSYRLQSEAARKTAEWEDGIGRLLGPSALDLSTPLAEALRPYLDVVRSLNPPGQLLSYPGSPRIARSLIRAQDRLVLNELHPEDAGELRLAFAKDRQVKVLQLDGWLTLKSLLPPRERRGIVLIDPPFEERDELDRIVKGLRQAVRRFATGVYLAWYPIKDPTVTARFHEALVHEALVQAGPGRVLCAELYIRAPRDKDRLNGCGLAIVNPPYQLDSDLKPLLDGLAQVLGQGDGASASLVSLSGADITNT